MPLVAGVKAATATVPDAGPANWDAIAEDFSPRWDDEYAGWDWSPRGGAATPASPAVSSVTALDPH